MKPALRLLSGMAVLAALAAGAGFAVVFSGAYNISATEPHTPFVYGLLETTMRQSIRRHARDVAVPPLSDPELLRRGRALHDEHCVRCHGAPGVAPEPFALGFSPPPANLAYTASAWLPAELYYVIKHGIRMTGMPAWEFRLSEPDLWAVVAFVARLPAHSPAQYRATVSTPAMVSVESRNETIPAPDAVRGKSAIHQYACATCHEIPGVTGATIPVGPPLRSIATRGFLAGTMPNTPDNLVRWLRRPQEVHAGSAMPDLGLSERDARDIGAYLSTLK